MPQKRAGKCDLHQNRPKLVAQQPSIHGPLNISTKIQPNNKAYLPREENNRSINNNHSKLTNLQARDTGSETKPALASQNEKKNRKPLNASKLAHRVKM